jgi:putative Ca2+/H+ antiporter (TMEM165/GDT1 family)
MEALLVSTIAVALGEIGDKTQLLALILAARYRRPWPIVLGILFATLANHGLAGWLGGWLHAAVPAGWLRWGLALGFVAVAVWALIPDRLEDKPAADGPAPGAAKVFWITLVSFFLAEIGDKTQVATVALAARYGELLPVVAGTTAGMLLADVPAVWLGRHAGPRLPLKAVRYAAAVLFIVVGVVAWVRMGG